MNRTYHLSARWGTGRTAIHVDLAYIDPKDDKIREALDERLKQVFSEVFEAKVITEEELEAMIAQEEGKADGG